MWKFGWQHRVLACRLLRQTRHISVSTRVLRRELDKRQTSAHTVDVA